MNGTSHQPRMLSPSFYDPDLMSSSQARVESGRHPNQPNGQRHARNDTLGQGMPPANVLMRGYAQDSNPGLQDAINMTRRQKQARMTSQMDSRHHDPMSMHLLISNAILDSSTYEILSLEEIDILKKEYHSVLTKLEAKRRKLALELKVRDAAASLSRLHASQGMPRSPALNGSGEVDRRSRRQSNMGFLSPGQKSRDVLDKTDEELNQSVKRCEELASDIWRLEERSAEIQRKLLKHSTGVLGLTHQQAIKRVGGRTITGNTKPQLPDSPESSTMDDEDDGLEFGERSFYKSHERLDELGISWQMPQLADRMSIQDPEHGAKQKLAADIERHAAMITDAEQQLTILNLEVRNLISTAKIQNGTDLESPTPPQNDLKAQLDFLQANLTKVTTYQRDLERKGFDDDVTEGKLADLNVTLYEMLCQEDMGQAQALAPPPGRGKGNTTQIDYLHRSLQVIEGIHSGIPSQRDAISRADSYEDALSNIWSLLLKHPSSSDKDLDPSSPPTADDSQRGLAAGMPFSLENFRIAIQRLLGQHQDMQQEKTILRRQIEQQRQARDTHEDAAAGHKAEMETKTKELEAQSRKLEATLAEAAKHQRELADHRTQLAGKHIELDQQSRDLAEHRKLLSTKTSELAALDKEVLHYKGELNAARTLLADRQEQDLAAVAKANSASEAAAQKLRQELEERHAEVARLESEMEEVRDEANRQIDEAEDKHAKADSHIKSLHMQLETLNKEHAGLKGEKEAALGEAQKAAAAETDNLHQEVVRLKTELAMARAEVDNAVGSRAQRALDIQNNPEVKRQISELEEGKRKAEAEMVTLTEHRERVEREYGGLQTRCRTLEQELEGCLAELETGARSGIEWEREREGAEEEIDRLREKLEQLETEISVQRVGEIGLANGPPGTAAMPQTAGSRGSTGAGSSAGGTGEGVSLSVMRTEFKRMMRETRKEGMERLRKEVSERRKLEEVVRDMKRERERERDVKSSAMKAQLV